MGKEDQIISIMGSVAEFSNVFLVVWVIFQKDRLSGPAGCFPIHYLSHYGALSTHQGDLDEPEAI